MKDSCFLRRRKLVYFLRSHVLLTVLLESLSQWVLMAVDNRGQSLILVALITFMSALSSLSGVLMAGSLI